MAYIPNAADAFTVYMLAVTYVVNPGRGLQLPDTYLKWYEVRPQDMTFSAEYVQEARDFLRTEVEAGRLKIANQLGFVQLHHCRNVDFLLVTTWCYSNESWETAYVKELATGGRLNSY